MADTALLKNGRNASLTEAGWEVWPHVSDTKELVFDSRSSLDKWADSHDFYGKRTTGQTSGVTARSDMSRYHQFTTPVTVDGSDVLGTYGQLLCKAASHEFAERIADARHCRVFFDLLVQQPEGLCSLHFSNGIFPDRDAGVIDKSGVNK